MLRANSRTLNSIAREIVRMAILGTERTGGDFEDFKENLLRSADRNTALISDGQCREIVVGEIRREVLAILETLVHLLEKSKAGESGAKRSSERRRKIMGTPEGKT